jgi:type II secretion system protein G
LNRFTRAGGRGFTLVEVMMVVLIMGILLAIAMPAFIKARDKGRQKTCMSNLKQIENAKEQWAMDTKASPTSAPTPADLYGQTNYIKTAPSCPSSGLYTIGDMSTRPSCDRPASEGHFLP